MSLLKPIKDLWVEKYRPIDLNDLVIDSDIKEKVLEFKATQSIPHILFIGCPGIGKTTLAKIIVNRILNCQYLYINASDESGIDTIRTKVVQFSQTKSLDGKLKVIILDEADGITLDGQRALRNTMEEYAGQTRFILTGNMKHRIIDPIQSRTQLFDLTPSLSGCIDRVKKILIAEGIEIPENIDEFVKLKYPDLRVTINELQKLTINKVLKLDLNKNVDQFSLQVLQAVNKGGVLRIRKVIIENESKFNGDYVNLLRSMFNNVEHMSISDDTKRLYYIILGQHLYQTAFCVDQEINCFSCLVNLSNAHK